MKRKDTPSAAARRLCNTLLASVDRADPWLTTVERFERAIARALKAAEERGWRKGYNDGVNADFAVGFETTAKDRRAAARKARMP